MKKIIIILVGVCFFMSLCSVVSAQEDLGLGKRAAMQQKIYNDRESNVLLESNPENNILLFEGKSKLRISGVTCIHKVFTKDQLVHAYDQSGQVSLVMIPSQELKIRIPCPEERKK